MNFLLSYNLVKLPRVKLKPKDIEIQQNETNNSKKNIQQAINVVIL